MTESMRDREYELMAAVEPVHWWYCGLRDLIGRTLRKYALHEQSERRALDAGCGTGENLRLIQEVLHPTYLGGFDISPFALEAARRKVPDADVYHSDLCAPDFHADCYDVILSCDAFSMLETEEVRHGLAQLASRLRPGGLLVMNLPAYRWLASEHDVAVGTRKRFTRAEVRQFFDASGLEPALVTYRVCALFPAVVLARLPSMLGRRPPVEAARSDLARPLSRGNRRLLAVLRWENAVIMRGVPLPFGSSVYAVGRRPLA